MNQDPLGMQAAKVASFPGPSSPNITDLTPVTANPCDGSAGQKWTLNSDKTIRHVLSGKYVLSFFFVFSIFLLSFLSLSSHPSRSSLSPLSFFSLSSFHLPSHSNMNLFRCLDIPYCSTTSLTQLDLWDCHVGSPNEVSFFSLSSFVFLLFLLFLFYFILFCL